MRMMPPGFQSIIIQNPPPFKVLSHFTAAYFLRDSRAPQKARP
jgi:hypothetical protein